MQWQNFVQALEKEVDWSSDKYLEEQAPVVEEILGEAGRNRHILQARTEEIAGDDDLFRSLAPHMNYPRILMDKFVVYIDPEDRFRVRLHRFKSKRQNGGAVEKVHCHKWDCSTIMLSGSYRERQFEVRDLDEEQRTCRVSQIRDHVLEQGQTNSLPTGRAHQVINESEDEACITLFVRGPARQPNARIFDVPNGTFYNTYGPDRQTKLGLLHMGRVDPAFH
ncbi:hypothetical protein ACFS5L_38950 [Streptomyces phyllanthi]|uniref:Cupin domain-containing protein n=1 Tax=Streptomyces phyllanthi TaxID=1803180 RepID=A0A5N8VUM8_9ACTN|nr:hypothetical protein [Streptomyces phyllanthi]MPY38963.1 hypothetical protein [Streptomyces phyllanthi]